MNRDRWNRHRPLFAAPLPTAVKKPKIKWRPLFILWLAIRKTCTVLGAFMLFFIVLGVIMFSRLGETTAPPLPKKMVLYVELTDGLSEAGSGSVIEKSLGLEPPTVHEIVDAIDMAALDPRVKGMMARMEGGSFAPAQSQEIREAVKRFKAAGKFTKIYSTSYGESAGGLGRFYLASAFSERWMQPLGIVSIPGMSAEMPFLRGVLDKAGVQPQFFKRKDYKTAYENITDAKMSPQNREMVTQMINDIGGQIVGDVSGDLQMTPKSFEALIHRGLFTSREALQAKLVTHVDYVDVLVAKIAEDITGDPESDEDFFVDPQSYASALHRERDEKSLISGHFSSDVPGVALVYVTGAIMDTRIGVSSAPAGFAEEGIAAADEIAPALMEAADDPSIKAVIVRIDSPGGSPAASETILRAIDKVRAKKKPVIVSMGTAAASGGYWVAAHADRIFAAPTTLTGSIGVVGGKFSIAGLSEKVGVKWDGVSWGENSGIWSMNKPFNESESERMNAMLDFVYESFLTRVSEGRKMKIADVDKIAGGRVWTGRRASGIGLVDELGGLREAMEYTAKTLGAKDRFALSVITMPRPLTPFEEFLQLVGTQASIYEGLKFNAMLGKAAAPLMNQWSVMSSMGPVAAYEPVRIQ